MKNKLQANAEVTDPKRKISPLRPHDLRHTFAFQLAAVTGADASELERRLGHRSQRYIQRYTNPPEAVAGQHIENFYKMINPSPLIRLSEAEREEALQRFKILRPFLEEGVPLREVAILLG